MWLRLHFSLRGQNLLTPLASSTTVLQLSVVAVGRTEIPLAPLEGPGWPHLRARCCFERQYRRAAFPFQLVCQEEGREDNYLAYLSYILRFIVQFFDYPIKSGCDLHAVNHCHCHSVCVAGSTSVVALSDWTSQILSNCSTRAPGSTNHCMICTSLMPETTRSK